VSDCCLGEGKPQRITQTAQVRKESYIGGVDLVAGSCCSIHVDLNRYVAME
jgi:hypothetical protein